MATYFYIRDNVLIREKVVKAPAGSQILYDVINEVVGDKKAENGIPYAIEVDGWGELASIGELYETAEFLVEAISEEEFENF
ncbi:MAG: hypothetical protein J6T35_02150 [Bacteroidales bacterium]|nr:hypothetical protein [Bacteroidales bacterium]